MVGVSDEVPVLCVLSWLDGVESCCNAESGWKWMFGLRMDW